LMAKKALDLGLEIKPWVKASFAPGSKVVEAYLRQFGLLDPLEKLGFYLVGYGCTTCIGNSGPLKAEISQCIHANNLAVSAVLSGNRNFEGRIHPDVSMNWLASPPLVVAYAIAGTTKINLNRDSMCKDKYGNRVQMEDIWPDKQLVEDMQKQISASMYKAQYQDIFQGDQLWERLVIGNEATYAWQTGSTYIQKPDFFKERPSEVVENIEQARILALLGDSITTDHISPAGFIPANSPAGRYLLAKQVHKRDFNSYGARRGNHHVMIRGTFANIRLKNNCVENLLGGYTTHWPTQEILPIYEASERYRSEGTPLVVFAGKEYGTGSSRDWAAKGTMMLGVKAVIAESFERIHRSNLVGMGVLPCELVSHTLEDLKLGGSERVDIRGISGLRSGSNALELVIESPSGKKKIPICARLDTEQEHRYYRSRGVLPYVLQEMLADE
jgi:aconitate hydratase